MTRSFFVSIFLIQLSGGLIFAMDNSPTTTSDSQGLKSTERFSCEYCQRSYSRKDNLKKHIKEKHSGSNLPLTPDQTGPQQPPSASIFYSRPFIPINLMPLSVLTNNQGLPPTSFNQQPTSDSKKPSLLPAAFVLPPSSMPVVQSTPQNSQIFHNHTSPIMPYDLVSQNGQDSGTSLNQNNYVPSVQQDRQASNSSGEQNNIDTNRQVQNHHIDYPEPSVKYSSQQKKSPPSYRVDIDYESSPIFGRDEELKAIYRALLSHKPNIVLSGPAQIGKKSLIIKLARELKNNHAIPLGLRNKKIIIFDTFRILSLPNQQVNAPEQYRLFLGTVDKENEIIFIPHAESLFTNPELAYILTLALEKQVSFILSISESGSASGALKPSSKMSSYFQRVDLRGAQFSKFFHEITLTNLAEDAIYEVLRAEFSLKGRHGITISDDVIGMVSSQIPRYFKNSVNLAVATKILDDVIANKLLSKRENASESITKDDIWRQMAVESKIPLALLKDEATPDADNIEQKLRKRVVCQDFAISQVGQSIVCFKTGLNDPNKPAGVFLFLGPTGVGKTELAKAIAEEAFGSERNLIRLDMNEFMEKHTLARLWGAPPGYMGHNDGGQLTNALIKNPSSVILFDEIDKAHLDVQKALLSLFDEGRITSGAGETVSATNAMIIMTTNLAAKEICQLFKDQAMPNIEDVLKTITPHLKKSFSPEFYNRIKAIVPFVPIDPVQFNEIVKIHTKLLAKQIWERKRWEVRFSDDFINYLAKTHYNAELGVRPLVNKGIDDVRKLILQHHLKSSIKADSVIELRIGQNELPVVIVSTST